MEIDKLENFVSWSLDGYPLSHKIVLGYRDERNIDNFPRYLKLLKRVLSSKDSEANPNILNYKGDTLINLVIAEVPIERIIPCLKLILEHGGDINLVGKYRNGSNLAIFIRKFFFITWESFNDDFGYSDKEEEILDKIWKYLLHATKIDNEEMSSLFNDAIEERYSVAVDKMLDAKLAVFNRDEHVKSPKSHVPDWYKTGCWLRTIMCCQIDSEIETLTSRTKLHNDKLQMHPKVLPKGTGQYSSATHIVHGVPVHHYNGISAFGFFVSTKGREIIYWYDGLKGERLTRNFNFNKDEISNPELEGYKGEYKYIYEQHITKALHLAYKQRIKPSSSVLDKHGIFKQIPYHETIPWNEALLRYKATDIVALYVSDMGDIDLGKVVQFCERMKLTELPVYSYSANEGLTLKARNIVELANFCGSVASQRLTR